ncbi:hypothetical protein GN244_ATG00221 [Phytophthora infestans]|uniref:Uncharacterized protein n=1 Tax=Phytophthora infestans TaxID=4787 RepID=A0A833WNK7_PHYIN|nr:hypothetical protein GN244_ATG00221 [Phytophthora infestans]KAF4131420.1 hypothetical protein GN958_ATG19364 [Phytophthora infestans]
MTFLLEDDDEQTFEAVLSFIDGFERQDVADGALFSITHLPDALSKLTHSLLGPKDEYSQAMRSCNAPDSKYVAETSEQATTATGRSRGDECPSEIGTGTTWPMP